MKILKWILYIVLSIVALVLIIPLFMPSTVEVSTETEVSCTPAQVFHNAASFTDRNKWDPWLETEPAAEFSITPEIDYVGSEYTWSGEKIKSGKMVVDSVVIGEYIGSLIFFGDDPDPGRVEWTLEGTEKGTWITWTFSAKTSYPVERLMLNIFSGQMKSSFEKGLQNFTAYLDKNPPELSSVGEIYEGYVSPGHVLLMAASGTMDQYEEQMGRMFRLLTEEVQIQGLQMAGAPFTHYVSFDEATGITEYFCGVTINTNGNDSGDIKAMTYKEFPAVQVMHTGPYEEFEKTYSKLLEYIGAKEIAVTMEAFEFYITNPMLEPDVTKWQTLIAMPLK